MLGNSCPRFILPFPLKKQVEKAAIDERQAVQAFVGNVGGIENARRALELLALLSGEPERRKAA